MDSLSTNGMDLLGQKSHVVLLKLPLLQMVTPGLSLTRVKSGVSSMENGKTLLVALARLLLVLMDPPMS